MELTELIKGRRILTQFMCANRWSKSSWNQSENQSCPVVRSTIMKSIKNICETIIPNTDNYLQQRLIRFAKCEQLNHFKTWRVLMQMPIFPCHVHHFVTCQSLSFISLTPDHGVTAPLIPPVGDVKTVSSSEFPSYCGTNMECIWGESPPNPLLRPKCGAAGVSNDWCIKCVQTYPSYLHAVYEKQQRKNCQLETNSLWKLNWVIWNTSTVRNTGKLEFSWHRQKGLKLIPLPNMTWKPVSDARVTGRIKMGETSVFAGINISNSSISIAVNMLFWTFIMCQVDKSERLESICPSGLINCDSIH